MILTLSLAALLSLFATGALADPCEGRVSGWKAGQTFSGQVRATLDADSICVGSSSNPREWIEVRLADFRAIELNAPGGREARDRAAKVSLGKEAVCTVRKGDYGSTRSYDRVIATCQIEGRSLADLLRQSGVREGGR